MRAETAAPAQQALNDSDWLALVMHADAEPLLTSVFALIEPAVIAKRGRGLEELGYDMRHAVDLAVHPYPMSQTLHYAAGVLGTDAPPPSRTPTIRAGSRSCTPTRPRSCSASRR